MAQRHETDEDLVLVTINNVAASSLFSPNMIMKSSFDTQKGKFLENLDVVVARSMGRPDATTWQTPRSDIPTAADRRLTLSQPRTQKRPRHHDEYELAYLEATDREEKEKEETEADLAHISAMEAGVAHADETTKALGAALEQTRARLVAAQKQSASIKRIFGALGVCRDDFDMGNAVDEPSRKRRMVEIGQRLVQRMSSLPKKVADEDDDDDDAEQDDDDDEDYPSQSPKVAIAAGGASLPAFTPPSAFPVEAQVAAAALTLAHNDPAVAMLSLLEKALSSRVPVQPLESAQAL